MALTTRQKILLLVQNKKGISYITKALKISRESVQRHIRDSIKDGLIRLEYKYKLTTQGKQHANSIGIYNVNIKE